MFFITSDFIRFFFSSLSLFLIQIKFIALLHKFCRYCQYWVHSYKNFLFPFFSHRLFAVDFFFTILICIYQSSVIYLSRLNISLNFTLHLHVSVFLIFFFLMCVCVFFDFSISTSIHNFQLKIQTIYFVVRSLFVLLLCFNFCFVLVFFTVISLFWSNFIIISINHCMRQSFKKIFDYKRMNEWNDDGV